MTQSVRQHTAARIGQCTSREKDPDAETDFVARVKEGEVQGKTGTKAAFRCAEKEAENHHASPGLGCSLEGSYHPPEEDNCCRELVRGEQFPTDREPFEEDVFRSVHTPKTGEATRGDGG